jgi:hypothetical protein
VSTAPFATSSAANGKERVVRQPEALEAVRLHAEHRQVAMYRALRQLGVVRQVAARPVRLLPVGFRDNAALINAAISSSPVLRDRPGFNSLFSPAIPWRAKCLRRRQDPGTRDRLELRAIPRRHR